MRDPVGSAHSVRRIARIMGLPVLAGGSGGRRIIIAVLDTAFNGGKGISGDFCLPQIKIASQAPGGPGDSHADLMIRLIYEFCKEANALEVVRVRPIAVCGQECGARSIQSGIQAAISGGARVALMSLGGAPERMTSLQYEDEHISEAAANGMILLGAMGNGGRYAHSLPACVAGVTPVAACDLDGRREAYSGYCMDVRKRGVLAPGAAALGGEENGAVTARGTSAAAAVAAAVAAVIMAARPGLGGSRLRYLLWRSGFAGGGQSMIDAGWIIKHN